MSGYSAPRAPNVSQYLANLNTIPSAQDTAPQEFGLNDDGLDFFTNTEFFDFDMVQAVPTFEQGVDFAHAQLGPEQKAGVAANGPGYQFSEFQTFPPPLSSASPISLPPTPPNGLQGAYPTQPASLQYPSPSTGAKRKASTSAILSAADLEEQSRLAAEEDKRRRNTAASARFRVKKKQREQTLEKQTREMNEKVQALEQKVVQLEMENKWLKGLITEKSDGKGVEAAWEEYSEKGAKDVERSTEERKDGVGTSDGDEAQAAA